MDHIAILDKKGKFLDKIISGEKTIETRWYVNRISPRNKIKVWETIYFKDSGCPITAKATVQKIIQFEIKNTDIDKILNQYGNQICFSKPLEQIKKRIITKNYGILIFLSNPQKIKPFYINKIGFGISCAWISLKKIQNIIT